MVAEVVVTTAGAVYTPPEVMLPVEAVQVTPLLVESFDTVAVNVCVPPPMSVTVAGDTETLIAGVPPPPQPASVKATRAKRHTKTTGRRMERSSVMTFPLEQLFGGDTVSRVNTVPQGSPRIRSQS